MNYCLSCVSVQRILVTTSSILQSICILKSQCHMIPLFTYINTLKHQSLNVKLHSKQLLTTLCIFCYVDNTLEYRHPKWYGACNRLELLHNFRFRKSYGKCTVFTVGQFNQPKVLVTTVTLFYYEHNLMCGTSSYPIMVTSDVIGVIVVC